MAIPVHSPRKAVDHAGAALEPLAVAHVLATHAARSACASSAVTRISSRPSIATHASSAVTGVSASAGIAAHTTAAVTRVSGRARVAPDASRTANASGARSVTTAHDTQCPDCEQ